MSRGAAVDRSLMWRWGSLSCRRHPTRQRLDELGVADGCASSGRYGGMAMAAGGETRGGGVRPCFSRSSPAWLRLQVEVAQVRDYDVAAALRGRVGRRTAG